MYSFGIPAARRTMGPPPPLRPLPVRQRSKVPGGFETDEEPSPTKTVYDDAVSHYGHSRNTSALSKDSAPNSSAMALNSDGTASAGEAGSSMLDEKEIGRKLMDVESSFLPEQGDSPAVAPPAGSRPEKQGLATEKQSSQQTPSSDKASDLHDDPTARVGPPSETEAVNTSSLETMSSSPTAAAARRAVSRVVSLATMSGYETAEEGGSDGQRHDEVEAGNTTPTLSNARELSIEASPTPTKPKAAATDATNTLYEDADDEFQERKTPRKRPKYLSSRIASQRSSYSSNTSASLESASDLTIGAEYALQSGGGIPLEGNSVTPRSERGLARTISLGSVASGVSKLSEGARPSTARPTFDSLDESGVDPGVQTPRGLGPRLDTPTDTVINQRIRNLEVPGTVARKFRQSEETEGSDKATGSSTARVKNLTLKEQSNVIDKLQKENWKLKLKLYFMDQMLTERSDEAVKAMISENVELKTHKFSSTKEIRALKRSIRELEAKLRERDERIAAQAASARNELKSPGRNRQQSDAGGEVTYLRERVETYELEAERLRSDNAVKEGEKRRLAEMLKSTGERSTVESDVEAREEIALWKDLLETETARKDHAEEENRKLQEEIWRLKAESGSSALASHQVNGLSKSSRDISDTDVDSKSTNTLVEQLRSENAELKRDLGAQTSMLTSRNREKERLYQEIEDLKMGARRRSGADGSRSTGGTDSILERSASRAHRGRPGSRGSGGSSSRVTKIGDAERDAYENANDDLRDKLAALRLENQELATQLDHILDELEHATAAREELAALQQRYDELVEQTDQDVLAMQAERDEALQLQEEAELGFQDLRAEAQEKIDALEAELDQNGEASKQLEQELAARDQELTALRNEVRMTSEGLDKVEADVQAKVRRVKELELENEDIGRELESIEGALIEANAKGEKLTIELESRQSECAFLREEQDGCMIKIGDLETALRTAQAGVSAEKDKSRDLDARLGEERHQREIIGSKEKQEVQKMMNDLNREATTAKDESRRLKKSLETREAELKVWRERLTELEGGLHEVLGETNGSKSSFVHVRFLSLFLSLGKAHKIRPSSGSRKTSNILRPSWRLLSTLFPRKRACSPSVTHSSRATAWSLESCRSCWRRNAPAGAPSGHSTSSGRRRTCTTRARCRRRTRVSPSSRAAGSRTRRRSRRSSINSRSSCRTATASSSTCGPSCRRSAAPTGSTRTTWSAGTTRRSRSWPASSPSSPRTCCWP